MANTTRWREDRHSKTHHTPHTTGEQEQSKGEGPNPNTGHHDTHRPTAFQHGHHTNRKGDTNTTGGNVNTRRGVSNTAAALPLQCHPTLSCHPTIHNAPTHHHDEGGVIGGYPTERTPQTHTQPHTTHPATNSSMTRRSTQQHCSGTSRTRATHTGGGQDSTAHTTAIPHTTHGRGWTPSTHLTLFTFTQSTNDHDQH